MPLEPESNRATQNRFAITWPRDERKFILRGAQINDRLNRIRLMDYRKNPFPGFLLYNCKDMTRKLARNFFNRPTLKVARELLGKFLARAYRGKTSAVMITEVEAYDGFQDLGSHARRGKTARNWPMYGQAGHWYVYFTYGMHWMLNVVTREKDYPAAVLIRAGFLFSNSRLRMASAGQARKLENKNGKFINGPGKLTKVLKIDGHLSGKSATPKNGLWIEDRGVAIPKRKVKRGKRIGIDYAGPKWAARPWRFWIGPDSLT